MLIHNELGGGRGGGSGGIKIRCRIAACQDKNVSTSVGHELQAISINCGKSHEQGHNICDRLALDTQSTISVRVICLQYI